MGGVPLCGNCGAEVLLAMPAMVKNLAQHQHMIVLTYDANKLSNSTAHRKRKGPHAYMFGNALTCGKCSGNKDGGLTLCGHTSSAPGCCCGADGELYSDRM